MRSYLSTSKFFQKMKKKQHVQDVLDNLQDYTEDEINCLPNVQQWIKDELIELKKRNGKTADDAAYDIAMKMIAASRIDKE